MIPGLSKAAGRIEGLDEVYLNRAGPSSFHDAEGAPPSGIIDGSRRRRIASSSTHPADVNRLLKQYREAKKLMQMMASGHGPRIPPGLRLPQ
jgi:signal recognition particle GTPase